MEQIQSSLALQTLMYYQGVYSSFFFSVAGGVALVKRRDYEYGNAILELLTVPIFVLWSMTEFARVYLGYVGNLKEKVPMVSAFLLLTIFPQLLVVVFFTFLQDPLFPFDKVSGGIMLAFLVAEVFIGKYTLDALITSQTAQFFRLCSRQEEESRQETTTIDRIPSEHKEQQQHSPREASSSVLTRRLKEIAASSGPEIRRRVASRLRGETTAEEEEKISLLHPGREFREDE